MCAVEVFGLGKIDYSVGVVVSETDSETWPKNWVSPTMIGAHHHSSNDTSSVNFACPGPQAVQRSTAHSSICIRHTFSAVCDPSSSTVESRTAGGKTDIPLYIFFQVHKAMLQFQFDSDVGI